MVEIIIDYSCLSMEMYTSFGTSVLNIWETANFYYRKDYQKKYQGFFLPLSFFFNFLLFHVKHGISFFLFLFIFFWFLSFVRSISDFLWQVESWFYFSRLFSEKEFIFLFICEYCVNEVWTDIFWIFLYKLKHILYFSTLRS